MSGYACLWQLAPKVNKCLEWSLRFPVLACILSLQCPDAIPFVTLFAMTAVEGSPSVFAISNPSRVIRLTMSGPDLAYRPLSCRQSSSADRAVGSLGVSFPTIRHAVHLYRREGTAGFIRPLRRRGRTVVTPALTACAVQFLATGLSQRDVDKALDLSSAILNENCRAGIMALPDTGPATPRDPVSDLSAVGTMTARDRTTPMGYATHDAEGRVLTSLGALEDAIPQILEPANAVANGGILTAMSTVLKDRLLDTAAGLAQLPKGFTA